MSTSNQPDAASAILEAIRAKRENKSTGRNVAELEAALLADIEAFDLDTEERNARREQQANSAAGLIDPTLKFPEITPGGAALRHPVHAAEAIPAAQQPEAFEPRSSLLNQLRQQAEVRQHELHLKMAEHTVINEQIDQALKHLFFFLHDFVQQLNIVKPPIPRDYPLNDELVLNRFTWQEGFADYRTQSQSAGALIEMVTFSCQFDGTGSLFVEREGAAVDRFRDMLFNYGLQFTCKEYRNQRSYVERAEFSIRNEISVSARWRANFDDGTIVLETRNLDRLGGMRYTIQPKAIDDALFDEFGRLVLAQPNRFRELVTRR